jgi:hypothetical protein
MLTMDSTVGNETTVRVEGDLADLAAGLRGCGNAGRFRVVGFLPVGDYLVDVAMSDREASVKMHVTLRENHPEGGTWWTTRSLGARRLPHEALADRVGATVLAEVLEIRRLFRRLCRHAEC